MLDPNNGNGAGGNSGATGNQGTSVNPPPPNISVDFDELIKKGNDNDFETS